ncbi:related to nucleoporin-interacting protein NIC96 [Cephalotrichum gorgonifer]|uniref:Related to nucleoporin-interacting protein NIC96 n=1 Tax=Cephalotrichum gorgonifer TaxID=2041049 RepID=A0AAE8N0H7_9PEZI|nr:related to nucleoporin-interacting protein NIC96 [Cephalotrichum gorgonifer]
MSLFGGGQSAFGQSSASQAGSVFGQSTATTQAAPGSSLFGASTATKPSLFGQSTATQPAASTGGGLFGGGASQPSGFGASQSTAFGATNTTAKPSLFGSTMGATTTAAAPAQNQPPSLGTAPSTLGLSALGTTQNQGQQQPQQQQPAGAYFDTLFAMTKKRADGGAEDMPHLQLGLGDLRQRLKKLGGKTQEIAADGRAHYVLAASGIDIGAAAKDLGSLAVHPSKVDRHAGEGGAAPEIDVETYLANLQTKTTLGMIQDGLERSARDFDNFLEDNMALEWEAQRKRVYSHFGIKQRDAAALGESTAQAGFGRSRRGKSQQPGASTTTRAGRSTVLGSTSLHRSVIGTPARIGAHKSEFSDVERPSEPARQLGGVISSDDRALREKESKLAKKVRDLNEARLFKRPYPILSELAEVEQRSPEPHATFVSQAYRAVMEIVGEDPEADSSLNNATAKERQYVDMHLNSDRNSAEAMDMRNKILAGANRFLENRFVAEMEVLIKKHPQDANLGGRPDIVSKVKAYIRLRSARKDLVPDNSELQQINGEYVWAVVFYLLRSGHVLEAASYVHDNLNSFRGIDRTFSTYLNGYASSPDRRLKRMLQDRCASEYGQRARNAPENSIDPFRMACYKIIGRCEVSNRSFEGLNSDIHDWVWLQFNLAREADKTRELAHEMYDLADLQASIREIGAKHFPKSPADDGNGGNFGMYFYLLALSGQFEDAVSYLYPFSYVDAVHFGLALTYYGLLRPSDPLTADNELRSTDSRSRAQINFGRMLGYYTRDFRAADAESAVDYLSLVCLNGDLPGEAGLRHTELCHEALRELVLETREFSKLIGDIRPDGQRIRGAIELRAPLIGLSGEDDFVRAVTLQAASFAEENGRTTDAVLLYHLAGEYDTVIAIVSRALSDAVALEIGQDPMVLAPVKPRAAAGEGGAEAGSSLSLAAIDDPVELARTMTAMYSRDAMFYRKIKEENKEACRLLLEFGVVKGLVEARQWAQCLDRIITLDILPLQTPTSAPQIRKYATAFASLPAPVAANVPHLLLWTITCCVRQKELLLAGSFTGNEESRNMMVARLRGMVADLVSFTGQLRYRFSPGVHEALARASAE